MLVDSHDRIWFTVTTRLEPWTRSVNERTADGYVGLVDENGVRVVADGFVGTNEIRFDEQEEWLYVVESNARRISRVRVDDDGGELERQVYGPADIGGIPDGFAFDAAGNLWITLVNADRLIALTPEGDVLTLLDDGDPARVETWDAHFQRGNDDPGDPQLRSGLAGTDDGERDLRRARPPHGIPRQPDGDDDPVLPLARAGAAPAALDAGRRPPVSADPIAEGAVRLDGGEALARTLVAAGVQDVFGVPAGKLGPFLGAVAREPRLRHLGTRHEASAAWMATATFHATGRIAACYGEMGPGAHNLVGGLGTARANGLAVLVLTSGAPMHLGYAASGLAMAADVPGLMRATTKWSAVARSPERIPELVRAAVREALSGRPGPVHLELPADVLAAAAEIGDPALDEPVVASPAPRPAAERRRGGGAPAPLGGTSPARRGRRRRPRRGDRGAARARRAPRRSGDRDPDGPRRRPDRRSGVLRSRRADRRRGRDARPAGGRRRAAGRVSPVVLALGREPARAIGPSGAAHHPPRRRPVRGGGRAPGGARARR